MKSSYFRFYGFNSLIYIIIFCCGILCTGSGCKKLVEVSSPITSTTSENAFAYDATAIAVLTGVYTTMSNYSFATFTNGISFLSGLSADELILYNGVSNTMQQAYYLNELSETAGGSEIWSNLYQYVYTCNAAILGLSASKSLTPAIKSQLLGEAKFDRALCYFYLINLYGDVPLVLGTDYKANAVISRTPKAQVWNQVIADLTSAQQLLSSNYLDATLLAETTERVRPTSWAATALLARSYLYTQKWDSAEDEATSIINNNSLFSLNGLDSVFLSNSQEAIWQLQPVNAYVTNTWDGYLFILPATGPDPYSWPVYLNRNLLDSFESGDNRRSKWVDSVIVGTDTFFYPFKYKANAITAPVTEYLMVLRLGEQYLIRAEARAQLSNLNGAASDLNAIRGRAGLPANTPNTQSLLLSAIRHERQVELFTEWGHRWLDLKRTGNVDAVMTVATPQKGNSQWISTQQLYPLPLTDIQADPNLKQNPGY